MQRLALLLMVSGLWASPGFARPQVVTTNTIIGDWAEHIGGDRIEHTSLLPAGVDPHIYEPVPSDSRAIETADLVIFNGYNLEPALSRLIESSPATHVALAEAITAPLIAGGKPDPHVWGNVDNAIAMVEALRDALIEQSPNDRASFERVTATYIDSLGYLDTWIAAQIATIPAAQRQLVTTHDAFAYYSSAYGLNALGTLIGISTEEQPSARTVARLVRTIEAANVPVIFAETTLNPALIQTVADEAGIPLADRKLYADSLGTSEATTYIEMMVFNTETIVTALGGDLTPFGSAID